MFVFVESLHQKSPAPQRGVKRPREGSSGRKRVWLYFFITSWKLLLIWKPGCKTNNASLHLDVLVFWGFKCTWFLAIKCSFSKLFRVGGGLFLWSAEQQRRRRQQLQQQWRWRLLSTPNWTTCTGLKPGEAGCSSKTSSHKNVRFLSCSWFIFHLSCTTLPWFPPSSRSGWSQRRRPSVRLRWAQLRSVSLHQRSAAAERGELQPGQHLLPVPGNTAGDPLVSLLPDLFF